MDQSPKTLSTGNFLHLTVEDNFEQLPSAKSSAIMCQMALTPS